MNKPNPVVLCILDGWGESAPADDNAISLAHTPNWDRFLETYPKASLDASAQNVGLPSGQMGNSEVGHMNLGAGRIVMQDLPRIDKAVAENTLADRPNLQKLIADLKETGGTCHLMGLLSPGGVHSSQDHMVALAKALNEAGVKTDIHGFLDGRDTPPQSAKGFVEKFETDIADFDQVKLATLSGRFYAMDRDNRWERVSKAYDVMTSAAQDDAPDAKSALAHSYSEETFDEFVLPIGLTGYEGMKDGDAILMANFRADRAREILAAFADPEFDSYERTSVIKFCNVCGMVEYSSRHNTYMDALFPSEKLTHILGQVVSEAGLKQLRIAETEKYAHVTFFLNGGEETVFDGEERILIPSPKVATYDLKPEMSAPELTSKLVDAISSGSFDLIVVNYANGDMVGHTGVLKAAIEAAQCVDHCLKTLEETVASAGGVMFVTADHGNLEKMSDPETGQAHTAHTLNRVPAILVNAPSSVTQFNSGVLADVAPTLLDLMGLEKPAEMTGKSLINDAGLRAAE